MANEHARDRDKDHDRYDRSRGREKDYEKQGEREKVKDKDRERGKDRGREKDRDKVKDREREKDKLKDREREEREKVREDSSRNRKTDYDKPRTRNKDQDAGGSKGVELDERREVGNGDTNVDGKAEEAESAMDDHDKKPVGSQSNAELEERLKKMKQERLKRKAEDTSEISSWLSKSRRLEEKRNEVREKAARVSKILDEQDNFGEESDDEAAIGHSKKDLAGVKILHGLDKVLEGGAVVLTLKDQSILADGDINEEIDMLENVEIGEQRRRDDAYKAAKKRNLYEEAFNDDMGSRKTILPQYDDPVEDEGVTLDEGGRFTGEAEKKLEELRKRIEGGSISRAFEDLNSAAKSTSDYYTPDEILQFKKPKKKKSLRKKDKLDLDALEAEAKSAGLGVGDLGSRKDSKRLSTKEEAARIESEMRSNAYQSALAKAEEASKVLRQEQTLTGKDVDDDDMVFGEDYDDLEKSLAQARKLTLKRKEEDAPSGPQAVALLASAKGQEDTQSFTVGEPQENKVVITEMEEFVLGLQLNEDTQKPELEDVFNDGDDIAKPVEHKMEIDVGGWTEIQETNDNEQPATEDKEDVAPDEIIHEVAVGKGLSGALKLLKDRGTLKESIDWGGRNMDKKKSKLVGINDNDGPKEIRIERTDEFGRIMTPKEAFRMISHKFHGKGPGKMKQEKRMKQYQEDLKTKQMKASDTPLLAMERMREAQAQLKSPYIVLSGHVKPGQTSDPRSGYATLEKDHPGSLTPMLGEKKVEHFLGINRKS
ncbi:SART-1 family protein DOT2 [Asparagus officinalis]|nr:SART-1 family protein DOT2 [Asparagus officinalis]